MTQARMVAAVMSFKKMNRIDALYVFLLLTSIWKRKHSEFLNDHKYLPNKYYFTLDYVRYFQFISVVFEKEITKSNWNMLINLLQDKNLIIVTNYNNEDFTPIITLSPYGSIIASCNDEIQALNSLFKIDYNITKAIKGIYEGISDNNKKLNRVLSWIDSYE